jgi:indole-3-glycerol phosphate synthase
VIAEIKRKSPSKGDINMDLIPEQLAREYELGGASCLSVLTDGPHFAGSVTDLRMARAAVQLPVLRKDFTVCALDVLDARLMGADAVLLIVAALSDRELSQLHALAQEVGLDALVEVHDEMELDRALAVNATCIGVNQRDLHTFHVDPQRAVRLATRIPEGVVAVAESGITGADDARRCAEAGYRAVLVGEHLVRSADREMALTELRVALPS